MSLMISVSGIRGVVGESLTPKNLTAFAMSFAAWTIRRNHEKKARIVIGRDTRPTGKAISDLVSNTLLLCGCDVIDLGMIMTQMMYFAQYRFQTNGGAMITASHNPHNFNGFKLATGYSQTTMQDDVQ